MCAICQFTCKWYFYEAQYSFYDRVKNILVSLLETRKGKTDEVQLDGTINVSCSCDEKNDEEHKEEKDI
jgi:hypothetical protein